MENEFIPYEQALALKELGFDEPCMCRYYSVDTIEANNLMMFSPKYPKKYNSEKFEIGGIVTYPFISSPLYQQVFRWFREDFGLLASEVYDRGLNSGKFPIVHSYSFRILNLNNYIDTYSNTFNNYNEAELECLKKLIELLIERNDT